MNHSLNYETVRMNSMLKSQDTGADASNVTGAATFVNAVSPRERSLS